MASHMTEVTGSLEDRVVSLDGELLTNTLFELCYKLETYLIRTMAYLLLYPYQELRAEYQLIKAYKFTFVTSHTGRKGG